MLVMLAFHTFGFSLGEVLFAAGLVFLFIPPFRFFAVVPNCVTLVTVDVVTVCRYRVTRNFELVGHCLHELGVVARVNARVLVNEELTDLKNPELSTVGFTVTTRVFCAHFQAMGDQPCYISRMLVQPFGTRMVGEPLDAVVRTVCFLDVLTICIKGPRSQQLKRLCRHFYYKFVRQIASSEALFTAKMFTVVWNR
jgi:hypothetical protein